MVRKISFAILAVAVFVTGIIGFQKLRYWDRSVRIFSMNSDDMRFEGRGRDGRGGFEGRDRRIPPDSLRIQFEGRPGFDRNNAFREMPDSLRTRFEGGGFSRDSAFREMPDSLRARFEAREGDRGSRERFSGDSISGRPDRFEGERLDGARFEAGFRERDGRGRDGFRRGRQVRLRTVFWFLAVFAGFTVVSIYADKALKLLKKRRISNRVPGKRN